MKKKILILALILMLVGAMFVLTGCGSDSDDDNEEYSEAILEVKDGYFENSGVTKYTIGELMDEALDDTTWKEESLNYYHCVVVEGTKKDSGETYTIYFYLGQLDTGKDTYPFYAIYVDGEEKSESTFSNMLSEAMENIIAEGLNNYSN